MILPVFACATGDATAGETAAPSRCRMETERRWVKLATRYVFANTSQGERFVDLQR
ncbi:hypothetical protein OI25_8275 (plasmid) [Paraburkholderia fungorum]|jgi:hypothetical protein|uniref:Uncharacterized protein n=1 Tax=Paraburkholderia fungorum TaxID=134537 RepID=A0AAW3V200_9BURK|nr:hypothetical protein OI25_8275 [Paraburkholderia fungorum]MBB4516573.1 hypothetical protein [Paraburkholderia fungorum]MBB5545170.1 hypothetical protein [Paraburkholderia fungorum]MBB6204954.1 hypothetical protein [Paraburkholderia fungorum]PRZ52570.1 hypothetical protein BX589_114246 [Paraburkholderia fungorum]